MISTYLCIGCCVQVTVLRSLCFGCCVLVTVFRSLLKSPGAPWSYFSRVCLLLEQSSKYIKPEYIHLQCWGCFKLRTEQKPKRSGAKRTDRDVLTVPIHGYASGSPKLGVAVFPWILPCIVRFCLVQHSTVTDHHKHT